MLLGLVSVGACDDQAEALSACSGSAGGVCGPERPFTRSFRGDRMPGAGGRPSCSCWRGHRKVRYGVAGLAADNDLVFLAVADDYALAESDRVVLAAQARSPGHLFRTKAAYTGGIDGCVDDVIAFIRPWNFDVGSIQVPVSIWYGPDDALCPRAHTDWLLRHIPEAEARERIPFTTAGDDCLKPSFGDVHSNAWVEVS